MCLWGAYECSSLKSPEEGIGFPGVTGSCEPLIAYEATEFLSSARVVGTHYPLN